MPIWLFALIAQFVKEVLQEVLKDVDWAGAKLKFEDFARRVTPGTRFDDAAAFLSRVFFDVLAGVLKENPNLTFAQAARISKRRLPMALAMAHANFAKGAV